MTRSPAPNAAPGPATAPSPLKKRAARSAWRRDLAKVWLPVIALAAAGFLVAWQFVEPAPPSTVRLATGAPGGGYERIGEGLAAAFAKRDVYLQSVATDGSTENLRRLAEGDVDAALVQGGTLRDAVDDPANLQAVISVDFELVLLAVRRAALAGVVPGAALDTDALDTPAPVATLDNPALVRLLAGRRVAVGPEGSGSASLGRHLLAELGLTDRLAAVEAGVQNDPLAALRSDACDAAFFVLAPDAPKVAALLADPQLAVVGLAQSAGLAQRSEPLGPVVLARGVIDPARDLPAADLPTVAATAYLAVRTDTHRAVVQLLVRAAEESRHPRLVGAPDTFPTLERADLPVAKEARYFFERGPNVLYRTLPFWIASTVDRLAILAIPLITVLIPLMRIAPPTLRWRIRRRIYLWYRQLRVIDDDLGRPDVTPERLAADRDQLRELDDEVSETDVPLSYMEEFYNLRLHIAYMRRRVDERLDGTAATGPSQE